EVQMKLVRFVIANKVTDSTNRRFLSYWLRGECHKAVSSFLRFLVTMQTDPVLRPRRFLIGLNGIFRCHTLRSDSHPCNRPAKGRMSRNLNMDPMPCPNGWCWRRFFNRWLFIALCPCLLECAFPFSLVMPTHCFGHRLIDTSRIFSLFTVAVPIVYALLKPARRHLLTLPI